MAVSSVSSSNYYTQAALTSPVSVSVALAALKANPKAKVKISDTTENISRNFSALNAYANNLTEVAQTNESAVISVSEAEFTKYAKLWAKFTTSYQLNVTNAHAASAATLAANAHVKNFSLNDSSANFSSRLDALQGLGNLSKLNAIMLSTPAVPLTLSATQYSSDETVLSKIVGNYSLAISEASATTAIGYADDPHIKSIAVLDTAEAISSNLDGLVNLGLRLKEVRGSDSNVFSVTASQMQSDSLVIGRLYKGYQLSVLGASLAQAKSLASNKKVVTVSVEDTAANVGANLSLLNKLGASLTSIHITDVANTLQLTSAQLGKYSGVLDKIKVGDDYQLGVMQATAAQAQALLDKDHIASISVVDAAQAISAMLDQLEANTKLADISIIGKANALNLTYDQLSADSDAIQKITSNYVIRVRDVAAADALALATGNPRVATLSVSDTAGSLTGKLDDLVSLGARLTAITNRDNGQFSLTESRWHEVQPVLDKVTGGYGVALTEVSAANALALAGDSRVQSLAVKDTGAAIATALDRLNSLGSQLTAIEQTDTSNSVPITAWQWRNEAATLAKFGSDSTFAVRSAAASQVTALAADTRVSVIGIADSSANIAANLDAVQTAIDALAADERTVSISIRQVGPTAAMALTATQLAADTDALAAIAGAYSLKVGAVAAASAAAVAGNTHVAGLAVRDTGAAIVDQLSALSALGGKLLGVQQTDLNTNIELTMSQWSNDAALLKKFQYGVHANVSGVSASQAQALLADSRVDHIKVNDTAAQVSAKLNTLQALGPNLTAITLSDVASNAVQLSMQQFSTMGTTLDKIAGSYKLAVSAASAADAQTLFEADDAHVQTIAVSDTSANIAAALDQLNDNSKLTTITQTGVAQPLSVTAAQVDADATALGKITGSYSLSVTGAHADEVATLASNSHVASMFVTDSAANVQDKLADLTAAGAKVVSVALSASPATLSLTYNQWLAHQPTLGKITSDFHVAVTDVGAANAALVAASPLVSTVAVKDATSRIRTSLDALASILPKLETVTATDASPVPTMAITAAQYSSTAGVLAKIVDGHYSLNVTGANVQEAQTIQSDEKVVGLIVVDNSENIASHLAELNANDKVSGITNSTPNTVMAISRELFNSSAATLAKINSYHVNVSDALVSEATSLDANSHVTGFTVRDTSAHLGAAFANLATLSDKLTGVSISSDDAAIALSQTQLNNFAGTNSVIETLAKVSGDYRLSLSGVSTSNLALLLPSATGDTLTLNPGASEPFTINLSKITSVAISDTSANMSAAFDDLLSLDGKLTSIALSNAADPIALTADQYTTGSEALSKITGGSYSLALVDVLAQDAVDLSAQAHVDSVSISDTADNIAAYFDDLQAIESKVASIEATDDNDLVLTQAQYDSALANKVLATNIVVAS